MNERMTIKEKDEIYYVNKDGLFMNAGQMSIFDINRVLKRLYELEKFKDNIRNVVSVINEY